METAPQGKKEETSKTLDEQGCSNISNTPSISSASSLTIALSCGSSPIWGEQMACSDYGMQSMPEPTPWPTGLFSTSLVGERLAQSDYAEQFIEHRAQAKYGLIGGHISRNESGTWEYGVICPPKHERSKCMEPQDDFGRAEATKCWVVLSSHAPKYISEAKYVSKTLKECSNGPVKPNKAAKRARSAKDGWKRSQPAETAVKQHKDEKPGRSGGERTKVEHIETKTLRRFYRDAPK
ncbi:hypothetical protein OE88DRAFT_1644919 [Heliocybe sulcata]|uniref:Uncharacterized protein n=1 Tax=Heliocybe sulcata TaxID=5364 RepID=A0A5C3N2G3_9AGAM|nr:hypothetical protein OE88DRAFT_1644919 [Heliocybe sulcata]